MSSLVWLERGKTPEAIRTAVAELEKVMRTPEYARLRRAFTVWINRIVLRKLQIKDPIPEFNDLQEIDAMLAETVTQWTQQWKMEGLQEGRQEGRQEGIRLGEAMGIYTVLMDCLTERFGPVPSGLASSLHAIQDVATLRKLTAAMFKTASLADFEATVDMYQSRH